jgi:Transglycosylase SLT domain
MQQFRPLPSSSREDDAADVEMAIVGRQSEEFPAPQEVPAMPIFFFTGGLQERRTDDLAVVSIPGQPDTSTLSLMAALQSTMSVDTGERMVVIPAGKRKRARTTEPLVAHRRRMSLRLRHGLVATVVFLVMAATLLSLTPLASGQSGFQVFGAFGHWVSQQAMDWAIQSHAAPAQPVTSQSNGPALPPVTLPKSQYIAIAQQDATNAGISPVYFVRQINQESGFNPYALSPTGAEGIAQFEPGTAAGLGINPWNPTQALQAAAQLMSRYNKNYGGNYAMALAAYNGGPGTVTYAVNTCGAAYWLNCLPGQTRNYIYVIMGI